MVLLRTDFEAEVVQIRALKNVVMSALPKVFIGKPADEDDAIDMCKNNKITI